MKPKHLKLADSEFYPYHLVTKEKENIWKEVKYSTGRLLGFARSWLLFYYTQMYSFLEVGNN